MFNLNKSSHVFYVLAWGYAGDHWYSWFAKALNAHPEIFALMAHEGSRPKYLKERSRSERPPLNAFTAFLEDMGTTYQAIGDCWSYRPWHFKDVIDEYAGNIPLLFLSRHPYVWLEFYTTWRVNNMRMADGNNAPLEHEWSITRHEYFKELDLKPYNKNEVEIWAAYQGMYQINKHRLDVDDRIRCSSLEGIISSKEKFKEVVSYLSKNRVFFSDELMSEIYSWIYVPFRGEQLLRSSPKGLYNSWPVWKKHAFAKIVESESIEFYRHIGNYEFCH